MSRKTVLRIKEISFNESRTPNRVGRCRRNQISLQGDDKVLIRILTENILQDKLKAALCDQSISFKHKNHLQKTF